MRPLLLALARSVLSGAAAGGELLSYTRYGSPYVDMDRVKALVDAGTYAALRKELDASLRACDEEYEPALARLYDQRRHDEHFELGKRYDECNARAETALARRIEAMLAGAKADKPADGAWFTCVAAPACVEYRIDDPADRQAFIARCANHAEGRRCPVEGRRCAQAAPGRRSVTYGGDVSNAVFRDACRANGGDYSCFGPSC